MNPQKETAESTVPSLYMRLGGYDGIAAIVDDFTNRNRAEPRLARFGGGRSADSRQRTQQLIVQLICGASGGPVSYFGRDMKTSHAGLGISEADWAATMEFFRDSMQSRGIAERDQAELLSILDRYKPDIVEIPSEVTA